MNAQPPKQQQQAKQQQAKQQQAKQQQQPRKQGGARRRRSGGGGGNKARSVDLWQLVPALPDPEPIAPSTDPRMLVRSLGDPPLAGQGAVAEHYMGAVIDRAAGLATALAAAAGLLGERPVES